MEASRDLLYGLNDRPPVSVTLFAALQHLLAIFVPIVTPALLICKASGVGLADTRYVVSMSLLVSGLATFIQIRRIGPLGSGLLSIQGTSFSFVPVLIAAGTGAATAGWERQEVLALLFGLCVAGSVIEMIMSRFVRAIRTVITPLVTGIVVTLIGLTLIKAGIFSCAGGGAALAAGTFGQPRHVALALLVLGLILLVNRSGNPYVRMSAVLVGLLTGYLVAVALGQVSFGVLKELPALEVPVPFKYGLKFAWAPFIPIALVYLVTGIETMGDITATSMVSREPVEGPLYLQRIERGVLADGFNSLLAAVFNTYPNTTFSQNNGIIQLTGIACRRVGYVIAAFLVLLGALPQVAGVFAVMPEPVLGGGTLLMFGTVAAAGIRLMSIAPLTRRSLLIIAVSLGLGLGVTFSDNFFAQFPGWVGHVFGSGIVTGALAAVLCQIILPPDTEPPS